MRCCSCPGLIMHAGSLSNLKSLSFLMHSKRVADWMKKKVGQTKALCVAHSSISSSTLPADMSMHFQSRKTHISAYYNIINNAILSSNTFDIVCMNDYEPPHKKICPLEMVIKCRISVWCSQVPNEETYNWIHSDICCESAGRLQWEIWTLYGRVDPSHYHN